MSSVDTWVERYRSEASDRTGAGIAWLDALRERALDRFASSGWPTARQEGWRHTSLAPLEQADFSPGRVRVSAQDVGACVARIRRDEPGHWLVFVDGRYVAGLSDPGNLPASVDLLPLSVALESKGDQVQALLGDETTGQVPAALNLAMAGDGAFIAVPRGVALDDPVHLVFVTTGEQGIAFPRNLISAESGAHLTVIEHYVSAAVDEQTAGAPTLTNAVTHLQVAPDAHVSHLKLQMERHDAFHLASIRARQGQGSVFNSHSMSFGARLARNDIATQFDGPRCETLLNGLYYVNARRHVDHNTLINHAHPHGKSQEYYRGILADTSRGVFGGRILVAPGADGTDAVQRSDSLLLSRLARADAKPELEIYADDVKCAHGATVGQLDENAMFYLRTRGMDETHARNLLTYAFAAEAIARMPVAGLRSQVADYIRGQLPGGDALGEIQ